MLIKTVLNRARTGLWEPGVSNHPGPPGHEARKCLEAMVETQDPRDPVCGGWQVVFVAEVTRPALRRSGAA